MLRFWVYITDRYVFVFFKMSSRDINPDVEFEAYNYDITLLENFKHFLCRLR